MNIATVLGIPRGREAVLRAQLADAQRDLRLWIGVAESTEESVYVREMQEHLSALERITEHRIEGRVTPAEDPEWDEIVRAFLTEFRRAKERRGGVVGNNISRLTAHFEGNERQASHAQNSDKTARAVESKPANRAMATGKNIQRLRKECGWSLDNLAEATGIDKKLILSHVNKGAKPTPRILKEYAQAFSKELGRTITAPELEE